MRSLVPLNEYGLFATKDNIVKVDSRFIAQFFEKRHANVIRDIENIIHPNSGLSREFAQLNFEFGSYKDKQNQKRPCYFLTHDGFTILVMGYTGDKAMRFKELYIRKFNEMENFISTLSSAREMFPLLTDNISLIHETPKSYHYSNECDLINRIVLGMSARKFREIHGIEKGNSIRPYLTSEQIFYIDRLQKIDAGLIISTPDYKQRKIQLEWYFSKLVGGINA